MSRNELIGRGVIGGLIGFTLGALGVATMAALKTARSAAGAGFDLLAGLAGVLAPSGVGGWLQILGLLTFGAIVGLMTAAVYAARHGEAGEIARSASA